MVTSKSSNLGLTAGSKKIYTRCGDKGYTCILGKEKISKIHIRVETYGSVDELNSFIGLVISSLQENQKPEIDLLLTQCLRIQNELLNLGSNLATAYTKKSLESFEQSEENKKPANAEEKLHNGNNQNENNQNENNQNGNNQNENNQNENNQNGNNLKKGINKDDAINKTFIGITKENVLMLEKEIDKMSEHITELDTFLLPSGSEIVSRLHVARTVCRRVEINLIRLIEQEPVGENVLPYINRLSDWFFIAARFVAAILGEKEWLWNSKDL